MLQNLAAVTANYRRAGIGLFVLAYFVRSRGEVRGIGQAAGLPLPVVRLTVPLAGIERRPPVMSPAAAARTCGRQRPRSRQPRGPASRTW